MIKRLGLCLVVMLLLAAPATAAGISVAINAESTVVGPLMTLGDLAVIDGDDKERVKVLAAAKLGNAPSPGHRVVLSGDILMTRLGGTGLDFSDVSWQVPPTVVVTTAAQTVSGEQLAAAADEAIRRQLAASDPGAVSVSLVGSPVDALVPLGRVDLKGDTTSGIRFNAPTTVVVAINVDGRPITSVSLKYNIKAYQQVVVAARNIAARETITTENIRLERREVGKISGYLTDMDKVLGQTARLPITAGTPLSEGAVNKPIIVKRGAGVTIVAKSGEMVITAGGQALQDGREGEIIRVQNLISKRIVNARVVSANTVEVIIYGGR
jgi:flagella basal body P-ring formation protein FlgA